MCSLSSDIFVNALINDGLLTTNSFGEKGCLPSCFRTSRQIQVLTGGPINLQGLASLNVSGSAQFSEQELDTIIQRVGNKNITVVNLRQEDAFFVEPKEGEGAIPVSYIMPMPWWTGEDPRGNRTVADIEKSEEEKMAQIKEDTKLTLYGAGDGSAPKDAHEVLYKVDIVARRTLSEKALVEKKGLKYHRIPDKKFGHMEDEHVDDLVKLFRELPPDQHLHFHCKKGQSRTTLFMIAFDIWCNAERASCNDIIKRQGPDGLGGTDMYKAAQSPGWDQSFKKGWIDFLHHFHAYCKEQKGAEEPLTWSEWKQKQGILPLEAITTSQYYTQPSVTSKLPRPTESYSANVILELNTINEAKQTVPNFRSSQDIIYRTITPFNPTGLCDYFGSGSSQFSKVQLASLIEKLKKTGKTVVIVDLRHDDRLYVNGLCVARHETASELMKPRTAAEITEAINKLKAVMIEQPIIQAHGIATHYPKDHFDTRYTLTIKPNPGEIETPEELVTSLKAHYHLVGSKRFSGISDSDVDGFLALFRSMPKGKTWYHFHCKKGKSRTTLFNVILDMMHNAKRVSWTDIIHRQWMIGGVNLFDVTPKDPSWENERENKVQWISFLARFHQYCSENIASDFALPWSEWSQAHACYRPDISHTIVEKK